MPDIHELGLTSSQEDESLQRWKESLGLGANASGAGKKVSTSISLSLILGHPQNSVLDLAYSPQVHQYRPDPVSCGTRQIEEGTKWVIELSHR